MKLIFSVISLVFNKINKTNIGFIFLIHKMKISYLKTLKP